MKQKILNIFILSVFMMAISCNKSEDLVTGNAAEGGLLETSSTALMYVVGSTGTYSFDLFVNQSKNSATNVSSILIYKSFYSQDTAKGGWSNEVLAETITISNSESHYVNTSEYTFANLIEGLTIDGEAIPNTDTKLNIGDFWRFRVVSQLSNGKAYEQAFKVDLTVSTRYAGEYKTIEAEYFRLGVLTYTTADWPAVIVIQSIDAITYKQLEYWGPFDGNQLYFQIDVDGNITYPAEWDGVAQTGNGQPLITCTTNPGDMTEVRCDESNYVQNDDVNGKDRLYMSFGYYTSGSGPRAFYQALEKIVE